MRVPKVEIAPAQLESSLFNLITEGFRINYTERVDHTIHASNLINFCPREYAIMEKHDVPFNTKDKKASLMELINYEIGSALHDGVRKALSSTHALKGKWSSCKCNENQVYVETTLSTDRFGRRVEGNVDTILFLFDNHYFGEIKSIGKEEFKTMTEPLVDHTCQLSIYLYMAELEKKALAHFPNLSVKEGFVIYVSKLALPTPIKVFYVRRNDSFLKEIVKPRLEEVKRFSKTGVTPDRICKTSMATRAKKCRTLSACWRNT